MSQDGAQTIPGNKLRNDDSKISHDSPDFVNNVSLSGSHNCIHLKNLSNLK